MNAYSKHHVEYLNLFDSISYVNTLTISISIEDCHGNCTDIQQQKLFSVHNNAHTSAVARRRRIVDKVQAPKCHLGHAIFHGF